MSQNLPATCLFSLYDSKTNSEAKRRSDEEDFECNDDNLRFKD